MISSAQSRPSSPMLRLSLRPWAVDDHCLDLDLETAKSNPGSAAITLQGFRDVLLRWCDKAASASADAPVVYCDELFEAALRGLDNLAVVASESMQGGTLAELYRLFAALLAPAPDARRRQIEAIAATSTSYLGDHVPTQDLREAGADLVEALRAASCLHGAESFEAALDALSRLDGRLASRGTRASAA